MNILRILYEHISRWFVLGLLGGVLMTVARIFDPATVTPDPAIWISAGILILAGLYHRSGEDGTATWIVFFAVVIEMCFFTLIGISGHGILTVVGAILMLTAGNVWLRSWTDEPNPYQRKYLD